MGFAIGEDAHADSVEDQDRTDSANLFKVLTEQVIPTFFQRDAQGIPRQWLQRIRRAMVTLVPQFTTGRMVREYAEKYYLWNAKPQRVAKLQIAGPKEAGEGGSRVEGRGGGRVAGVG